MSKPRVFYVHGLFSHTSQPHHQNVIKSLREEGYEVVEINYMTTGDPVTMGLQVAILLYYHGYDSDNDVYLGHSMGGIIGSELPNVNKERLITMNSPLIDKGYNIQSSRDIFSYFGLMKNAEYVVEAQHHSDFNSQYITTIKNQLAKL
jgi:hypothetical protein